MAGKAAEERQRKAHEVYQHLAYGAKQPPLDLRDVRALLGRFTVSPEEVLGYRQAAQRWLVAVVVAFIVITAGLYVDNAASALMVQERAAETPTYQTDELVGYGFSIANLQLVKTAAVIVPAFFFLRFAIRSYRINRHLEVVYSHRWALQSSLPEYLAHANSDAKRHELLVDILPFFYNDIDTGHISSSGATFRERISDRLMGAMRPPGESR